MNTFIPSGANLEAQRKWYVVDASGQTVGRLSTRVASILRGKHKPTFTPFLDMGDHVVIVNAEKVVLTGGKAAKKFYYYHTGYPGGIKERRADKVLEGRFPERVIEEAVRRMLPKGALGRDQLRKLHVYAGPKHPHRGTQPVALDVGAMNPKNRTGDGSHG